MEKVVDVGGGTDLGNTQDISEWAMAVYKISDSGNTSGSDAFTIEADSEGTFRLPHSVPNQYTKIAHKNSATDMDSVLGGVKMGTTYFVYISKTQPADTYSGQVIYTLVHPASHAVPVYLDLNADDISEVHYMQQFAIVGDTNRQSIIDSMVPEQQYTVLDSRDGKSYTIAKFQTGTDSNTNNPIYDVWMTKNLDLDLDSTRTYTNEDTDIGYNTTTGEYDTASWTPSASTATIASGWVSSETAPSSYDPGNLYWNGAESDRNDWDDYYDSCTFNDTTMTYENCDESLNPISTYTSSTGTAQYHLGNYYNWTAAVAMNDSSFYTTNGGLIEQSICPAGWTLPRIDEGGGSFYALWDQYGFADTSYDDANDNGAHDTNEDALWTSPLYFSSAGVVYVGTLDSVGFIVAYWSPVVVVFSGAGELYVSGAGAVNFDVLGGSNPFTIGRRDYGGSVRCVARPVANQAAGSFGPLEPFPGGGIDPGGGGASL